MPRSNTDIRQVIARSCGTLAVFRCGFHAVCRYVVFNHVFTLYVPVSEMCIFYAFEKTISKKNSAKGRQT